MSWDNVLVGEQAQAAFLSWQELHPPNLDYPKSFHSEVSLEMAMFLAEPAEVQITYEVESDTILHDGHSFEANAEVTIEALGYQIGGHFDLNVQPQEVAIRLRDPAYMGPLVMDLPTGYHLSGDCVGDSFQLLQEALEEAMATNPVSFLANSARSQDVWRDLIGPSAILHPNFFPSAVMNVPGTRADRWEIRDGVVYVEYRSDPSQEPASKEGDVHFDGIAFKSSFDYDTGETRSLNVVMVMNPQEVDRLRLTYDFQFSEIQTEPAKFNLADEDSVLDLNPYYHLIKEGRRDEIKEQFFKDLEALDQDFSF